MKRVCLVMVGLWGCGKASVTGACGRTCVQGERCAPELGQCVQNQPPSIRLDAPLTGAVISQPTFHLQGLVTDEDFSFLGAKASLDDGGTWFDLGVNPGGDFDQTVATPQADGAHVSLQVKVSDLSSAEGSVAEPVVFDRVPPTCTVLSPSPQALVGGATADVVLQVSDGSRSLGPAAVSLDQGSTWQSVSVNVDRATFHVPLPADHEGTLPLLLKGSDAAGNTCSVPFELQVDTRAPTLTEQAPVNGAVIAKQAGGVFTVSFGVHDGSGLQTVEVLAPPSPTWQPATVQNDVATFSWALPAGDDGAMRTLQLRATDVAGNVATHSLSVTVDVLAPTCTLTAPTAGQRFNAASGATTTIRWSVSDGSQAFGVGEVSTDDGATWSQVAVSSAGDAHFDWAFDPTADGVTTTVRVRGRDAAGNGCVERSAQVSVDVLGPTLSVTAPLKDAVLGAATAAFTGLVSDGSGQVASVTLDFADGAGPRAATLSGSTGWSLVVPTSATEDFHGHAVTVRAVDGAGNASTTPWHVIVDRVAPTLSVVSPTEGQRFGSAQLGTGATVPLQLQANDEDTSLVLEVQQGSGWVSVTGNPWRAPTNPLDDDVVESQTFRVRDTAGNQTQATRSYRVDRVAPTVTSTAPSNGGVANANAFTLQFSEGVQVSGASLPVSFTPSAPAGATFAVNGSTLTVTGLAGLQSYSAALSSGRVTDLAGNAAVDPGAVAFSTRGARPATGTVLLDATATQKVEWFRSSVDADGVVSLVVRVINPTNGARSWLLGWVDPRTGQWAQQDAVPAGDTGASLVSFVEQVNGTPRRRASVWFGSGSTGALFTLGTAGSTALTALQLAVPLSQYEQTGSDVGTFTTSGPYWSWSRPPNPALVMFSQPLLAAAVASSELWGVATMSTAAGSSGFAVFDTAHQSSCNGTCSMQLYGHGNAIGNIPDDCSSGTCVPACDVSFNRYVRTSNTAWYFAAQCNATDGWVGWAGTNQDFRNTQVSPNDLQVPTVSSVSAAGVAGSDTVWVASSNLLSRKGVALYQVTSSSVLSGASPVKTITVETLQPFKPHPTQDFLNDARLVFDPVPGAVPAVLYVATPGRLMYRE